MIISRDDNHQPAMVENSHKVKCITGVYPVCNIASYPGLKRACGAYGLTVEQLEDELAKHNSIDRLAPLAKAKVPIFHITATRTARYLWIKSQPSSKSDMPSWVVP